jgi:hypothetical protein
MSSILRAKVSVKGNRILTWHHFGIDALSPEAKERSGTAGNNPDEWRRTVLMDDDRRLYLLPTYFFGCIKHGGKSVKKGKSNLFLPIASCLQILDDLIYVSNGGEVLVLPESPEKIEAGTMRFEKLPPVYVEVIGVRNPSTKGRNIRYRVATPPGWLCDFTLLWDATIVNRRDMQAAVEAAGALVGVGDGRTSIGYGRFDVLSFVVQE